MVGIRIAPMMLATLLLSHVAVARIENNFYSNRNHDVDFSSSSSIENDGMSRLDGGVDGRSLESETSSDELSRWGVGLRGNKKELLAASVRKVLYGHDEVRIRAIEKNFADVDDNAKHQWIIHVKPPFKSDLRQKIASSLSCAKGKLDALILC